MTALPGNGRFKQVDAEIEIGAHETPMKIPGLTSLNALLEACPETQPHSAQVGTVLVP